MREITYMTNVFNNSLIVFVLSFTTLWFSAWFGASVLRKKLTLEEGARDSFGVVQAATLTLLALIIGFSFSMAVDRYNQRKNYEEEEANAIGTEYARADLLPPSDAAKVRALLREYLQHRLQFYSVRDRDKLQQINTRTAQLQVEMWAAVVAPATRQPTPVIALAVSGMNDVLNTQGYTQAAFWNRIPREAWLMMVAIAICCNLLVGYGTQSTTGKGALLLVLPLVISISFYLIADIDSPRRGYIFIQPQNLTSLAESLNGR
jgi:hypothetical protein